MTEHLLLIVVGLGALITLGILAAVVKWYKKVPQGKALVRTGAGGTKVSFNGIFVVPVLHRMEIMDLSLKSVEISRTGKDGLICQDNLRADIKVVFFVRVNKALEDVIKVAQSIGCERASHEETLKSIFDAKFSEALKTVGKQFDFVELYNSRIRFKTEIVRTIGTDLNGYILDDCAIDYLEQTPMEFLKQDNILDAQGIKKITELTATEKILANKIRRDEEKIITQQNVEAQEAILELNKQLAEKEEKQKREIASIKAREEAEIKKTQEEERLKAETARIISDEQIQISEENKERQVIVARKNKERTEAVEQERVQKDRDLEVNERERIVSLAQIEKEKAIEEEKRNIQEVIRERVAVEKHVVEEEERIKDTKAFAEAERVKKVALTDAEKTAEKEVIVRVKTAEANKKAAEITAEQKLIDAEADRKAAEKNAQAKMMLAEAKAKEEAAIGTAEAQVMEAKAHAREREAIVEAKKLELLAEANNKAGTLEADVIEKKAAAEEKEGLAQAHVLKQKLAAEASGIEEKANAMKKLDGVGKEHEEFKLRLEKETEIELARINIQKFIADSQAEVIAEALKAAKIDIVGGETMFFNKIIGSITQGKQVDRFMNNTQVLSEVKDQLLTVADGNGDGSLGEKIRRLISGFGITSEDMKNLSIAALLMKMTAMAEDDGQRNILTSLLNAAKKAGIADQPAESIKALS